MCRKARPRRPDDLHSEPLVTPFARKRKRSRYVGQIGGNRCNIPQRGLALLRASARCILAAETNQRRRWELSRVIRSLLIVTFLYLLHADTASAQTVYCRTPYGFGPTPGTVPHRCAVFCRQRCWRSCRARLRRQCFHKKGEKFGILTKSLAAQHSIWWGLIVTGMACRATLVDGINKSAVSTDRGKRTANWLKQMANRHFPGGYLDLQYGSRGARLAP